MGKKKREESKGWKEKCEVYVKGACKKKKRWRKDEGREKKGRREKKKKME